MKKGISLLVLIITLVVIVILATAVIVNLWQTNIITRANEAVVKQDFKTMQEELNLYISEKYVETSGELDIDTIDAVTESEVKSILKSAGQSKYLKYVRIIDGRIVLLDTMIDPEKTWAMEALNGVKISNADEIEKNEYVTTGLQCYLDTTVGNSINANVWNDISGNSNNAIINGCTYNDDKVIFDGVNDWIDLGQMHYPNFTYEIVIDFNKFNKSEIIGNWQNGGGGIGINDSGYIWASTMIDGTYDKITSNESLTLNKKYKITYTSDGNESKIYVNGKLMGSSINSGKIDMPDLMTITAIGSNPIKDSIDSTSFFNGSLYVVRVYDRALSENEVKQNYKYDNANLDIDDVIFEKLEKVDVLHEIKSLKDLEKFRDLVNNGYCFEGKYIELKTDIDLSSVSSWVPIGTEKNTFKGIFNGKNHTISNLTVNNEENYQGLFGNNDGIIENLIIESGTVKGKSRVGAIVGYNTGVISSCINKSQVESTNAYAGGICGFNSGNIQKCYNYGNITTTSNRIAGITGANMGNIKFCGNNGVITGSSSSSCYIAGIAAYFAGDGCISSSYNKGEIVCDGASSLNCVMSGGIVGGINSDVNVKIYYCYNDANVTGNGSHVGGIIGSISNKSTKKIEIQYCYNTGEIVCKRGNNNNNAYNGGIVGSVTCTTCTINSCYNVGKVRCISGNSYSKGIAGNFNGSISSCYVLSTLGLDVSNGGTKITEANMKKNSFLTQIGGDSVWYLDGGYPKLMWE